MITSSAWAGKRYAVLGLARSGAATVAALGASGAEVVAWDSDEARRSLFLPGTGRGTASIQRGVEGQTQAVSPVATPPGTFVPPPRAGEVKIADLATLDLSQFDALVLSPGVPLSTHPLAAAARAAGVPIVGDIELFAQARAELPPHKVVGITGTNGKSTTTALVTHILKTAGVPALMGGNIGVPILSQDPLPAGGVYVLELSSYQIDLTQTLDCDVAVLLNITPDHLDRYDGSFEAYAASKARLFQMQSEGREAVFGGSDDQTTTICNRINQERGGQVLWVENSFEDTLGVSVFDGGATICRGYVGSQRSWSALQGPHNAQNAGAAIGVCHLLRIKSSKIASALQTFPGLPHRMERVATLGGVTWYDDSKATNPESTAPALAAFPRVHWILGGRAKGDDLDACLPHLSHVARAYTIGEAGPTFARVLAPHVSVTESGTLETAVKQAAASAQRGEVVLLSPAAASFDQFRDYEHRGQVFRQLVEDLA